MCVRFPCQTTRYWSLAQPKADKGGNVLSDGGSSGVVFFWGGGVGGGHKICIVESKPI